VGIASADPASNVEKAAIEAQVRTRITILRSEPLSSFRKNVNFCVLSRAAAVNPHPARPQRFAFKILSVSEVLRASRALTAAHELSVIQGHQGAYGE
jgi:hypothetical protein